MMIGLLVFVWVVLGITTDAVLRCQTRFERFDHMLFRVLGWPLVLLLAVVESTVDAFVQRVRRGDDP